MRIEQLLRLAAGGARRHDDPSGRWKRLLVSFDSKFGRRGHRLQANLLSLLLLHLRRCHERVNYGVGHLAQDLTLEVLLLDHGSLGMLNVLFSGFDERDDGGSLSVGGRFPRLRAIVLGLSLGS